MAKPPTTLYSRIDALASKLKKGSPEAKAALIKIALKVIAHSKLNIIEKKIKSSAFLLNNFQWQLHDSGEMDQIYIGNAAKYAAMNEYGGIMERRQFMAMCSAIRWKYGKNYKSKGIVTKIGKDQWYFKERPYLRPAMEASREYILEIIRKSFMEK